MSGAGHERDSSDRRPRPDPGLRPVGAGERVFLAARLVLAMLATGLLAAAVVWRVALPEEADRATLLSGAAALLVAGPVLTAAWQSLYHPSLHGLTDRLIALAMIAAWAAGDLMTASLLPIIMIIGHVLEERSLLGSREAIRALTRLAQTTARLLVGGRVEVVPSESLRPGTGSSCGRGTGCRLTASCCMARRASTWRR